MVRVNDSLVYLYLVFSMLLWILLVVISVVSLGWGLLMFYGGGFLKVFCLW